MTHLFEYTHLNNNPMVSVCCMTYNQESFITQSIEGFLMQKTNFPIEIIIHDDASTDKTAQIIKQYAEKFPNLIIPILQTENQFSKREVGVLTHLVIPYSRGKYIALCEGDDYWVDPYKLQKQVDFLEANPDYTFSMGRVDVLTQKTGEVNKMKEFVNPIKKETYSLRDYLKSKFSQTSSFVFRNSPEPFPEWFSLVHGGDQSLVLVKTGKGKIKYHRDLFSIYRINEGSISFTATYNIYENSLETLKYWQLYLNNDYKLIFKIRSYNIRQYVKLGKCKYLINKIMCRMKIKCSAIVLKFL